MLVHPEHENLSVAQQRNFRFSEIPCLNNLICLILLKLLFFTPNTSDWAKHVLNLKLNIPKLNENINFITFKGFFNFDKIGKFVNSVWVSENPNWVDNYCRESAESFTELMEVCIVSKFEVSLLDWYRWNYD